MQFWNGQSVKIEILVCNIIIIIILFVHKIVS